MLKDSLYTITSFESHKDELAAEVQLNKDHEIFKGHFPDQPVLPGVCMMQIVKELTEQCTGKRLFLNDVAQCKFLSMIDPEKAPLLQIHIQIEELPEPVTGVRAQIKSGESVIFKMTARLQHL